MMVAFPARTFCAKTRPFPEQRKRSTASLRSYVDSEAGIPAAHRAQMQAYT